jgi:hypothetical protein
VMRLLALPLFAGSVSVSAWFISMLFRESLNKSLSTRSRIDL